MPAEPGPMVQVPRYPVGRAVALTAAAGLVGFVTDRVARAAGWRFPSFGYLVAELVWKLATIAIMVWALRHYEGRRLDAATTDWASDDDGAQRPSRARVAIAGALLAGAVSALIPNLVGLSSGSASAYGTVHKAGVALILAELLVRYPLTVFAEEAFFRGWLQPRLGRGGPALSAVLWGLYHLQQVKTIPQLIPYGIALGLLRWWRGNVRASAAVHYLGNVVFFLTNYA